MPTSLLDKILDALPHTQCQQCQHAGCHPYADAIVNQGERIDRCLPGGTETLKNIAKIMQQDPAPLIAELATKTTPDQTAIIIEDACIGCTKCLDACPVDAIVGGPKQMHTVLSDYCNGCELCLAPCPVDCIEIVPLAQRTSLEKKQLAQQSRQRYRDKQQRQVALQHKDDQQHQQAKLNQSITARKAAIAAAIQRSQKKKAGKTHADDR